MGSETAPSFTFDQIMAVIDNAFDYLSISSSEKERVISLIEKRSNEQLNINLAGIFQQEKLISDEEIEYLRIFDEHLKTLRLDHLFGKLVIANCMASKEDVDRALKHQEAYFKKYRIDLKIGDILVENKSITKSDQVSILLTQNRVKNENLLDALQDIGNTLKEKDAVNKRFGVLAIKKGLVTIEQVKCALDVQNKERRSGETVRFIGKILQETAQLSDQDILDVLSEQKQFEKRQLDLEKALYTVKSEIKISKKLNSLFKYRLSDDGVEAYAKKLMEKGQVVPTYEFLIWLKKIGIKFGISNDAVLESFIQDGDKNSEILVAKGYPAKQCTDERIEFFFENEDTHSQQNQDAGESDPSDSTQSESAEPESEIIQPPDKEQGSGKENKEENQSQDKDDGEETPDINKTDENEINKKNGAQETGDNEHEAETESEDKQESTAGDQNGKGDIEPSKQNDQQDDNVEKQDENIQDLLFEKGSLLARIIPGKEGTPGKDVLGYPVKPAKPSVCILNAGKGVIKKGANFFAQIEGWPVLKDGIISVRPVVEKAETIVIKGDINNDTKHRYESEAVEVKGSINPAGVLNCSSLVVHGSLMGSVICTGPIDVKGDVVTAENQKDENDIHRANITCRGSVKVSKSINAAKIHTEGELIAINSTLTGSEVIAFKGIAVKDVMHKDQTPSTLQFGLKPGDKIIATQNTIETKQAELSGLKKEEEISELTEEYKKDLEKEQNHLEKQDILKNIIEIIEAPELYQYEGLENKIKYLHRLPAFSSIKACYLKLPETQTGEEFRNQTIQSCEKMSLDHFLIDIRKKIDPEPEDEETESKLQQIETQYKARLSAFEREIEENAGEIGKLENEIQGLEELKEKLGLVHIKSLSQTGIKVSVKNKCEKGTIIRGRIAKLIVEETIYHSTFKEKIDPKTNSVSIEIQT